MTEDNWEGDYKKLTEIENIKTEVGKLRSDCRKLSKRIEMQGIQDQLSSLHDSLVGTQRFIAKLNVAYNASNTVSIITHQMPQKAAEKIRNQIVIDAAKATEKIETSKTPLTVADQLQEKYNKILTDKHLNIVIY